MHINWFNFLGGAICVFAVILVLELIKRLCKPISRSELDMRPFDVLATIVIAGAFGGLGVALVLM